MTEQEYTKHYYIEGERVCTKTCAERSRSIGGGFWGTAPFNPWDNALSFLEGDKSALSALLPEMIQRNIECADYDGHWEIDPMLPPVHNKTNFPEYNQYFYHSDHASTGLSTGLGSASFITDATGYVDQHIQYLPFGELFIFQRNSQFDSRYKFTAKACPPRWKLDNETNYTYFGARYYDSDISIWLSVDPLADQMLNWSPYLYCGANPVILQDPDGKKPVLFGVLERTGKAKYGNSFYGQSIRVGPYDVVPIYDKIENGNLIAYNAVRYSSDGTARTEYQMDPGDFNDFSDNVSNYDQAAKLVYASGAPDWNYVMMGQNIADGNYGEAFGNIGQTWSQALQDPGFWFDMGVGIAGAMVAGGNVAKGVSTSKTLKSASSPYKGSTVLGHSLSKHSMRKPNVWGRLVGDKSTWHSQALKHYDDIMNAPSCFTKTTNQNGVRFFEKRLPDGRGIRLNMNGTFKGFID